MRPDAARALRASPWLLLLALLAWTAIAASPPAAARERVDLGGGMRVVLDDDYRLFVAARPQRGEGWLAFARRLTGTGNQASIDRIRARNGKQRRLYADRFYRVPHSEASPNLQRRAIEALFPQDKPIPGGWAHVVTDAVRGQGLWQIARWFTGRGENFDRIRAANGLPDEALEMGQTLNIPSDLLLPGLRAAALPGLLPAPSAAPAPEAIDPGAPLDLTQVPEEAARFGLSYERGDDGVPYAVYNLKTGEALYSSVVVRFTGRTFAEDVNALAQELATENRIPDVTDMPVGQRVRIPFDVLLPEFLPKGDPRRQEYQARLAESARFSNTVRADRLQDILVILDPGHGGVDPGAMIGGVSEAVYVYDIMLRVRRKLLDTTAATVATTVQAGKDLSVPDRDTLTRRRDHAVQTNPPYRIDDPRPGVHLRWYLSNSLHRKALKTNGNDPRKVIFLSLHADALHPSLRGVMIYVPSASLTRGTYGKSGSLYERRREVREQRRVSYSWHQRTESEGLSRDLARSLIGTMRQNKLAIHAEKPVRDRIIRNRRSRPFVPAVIRFNAVPAKLLIEVCNLNNREDRRLIQTRRFRQQMADAIVEGILDYYGEDAELPARTVAAAAR
ncbi:MAG: N-acetylmuramoyl-L-alanine amidase [Acidobacteriota bacterium]